MEIFKGAKKQHHTQQLLSSYLIIKILKTEGNDKKTNGESTKTRWMYCMNNWIK